jgi:hypothetical protein
MSVRLRLLALIMATSLICAPRAFAQDAGVSGIPRGPGNAGGLNNSLNDPSGVGNAAKVAPPAAPSLNPPANPSGFPPASSRVAPSSAGTLGTRTRRVGRHQRSSGPAAAAALNENDRLLNQKLKSICRGC